MARVEARKPSGRLFGAEENVLGPCTQTTEKGLCEFLGHLLC